jgi:hypothetical protein
MGKHFIDPSKMSGILSIIQVFPCMMQIAFFGQKAVGVTCLELMTWVRVTGAGQVYFILIGGCAPDRVI